MNLRSIVCPVDFSEPSQQALRWAAAFARRFDGRLTVLTAVDPLLAEAARARLSLDLAKEETGPALREFARKAISDDAMMSMLSFDVRVGHPSEAILESAARERADLVVMGTQGLGGLRKMMLGSTAERVLRSARTPVMAVPAAAAGPDAPAAGATRLEIPRILVATDFSATAAAAVEWAASLARDAGTSLTLVHVVQPVVVAPQWSAFFSESDEPRLAQARTRLEGLSSALQGPPARDTVVSLGSPAETIASTAEDRTSGLIVMGLAGEHGALAPRPGSIAYRVLGLAKVPVVVVPPRETS